MYWFKMIVVLLINWWSIIIELFELAALVYDWYGEVYICEYTLFLSDFLLIVVGDRR